MDEKAIKKRVALFADKCAAEGADGAVVTSPANVSYLTGFLGYDSWALVLGRRIWLISDSRYQEQARDECPGCKIIMRKDSLAREVAKIAVKEKNVKTLGVENTSSLAVFDQLKKTKCKKLKKIPDLARLLRATKQSQEISYLRKASRIADKALESTLKEVRTGMTESELAGILELFMRKAGVTPAFSTIIAFGPNGSRNHHLPGRRRLRRSDTILIDFGVIYHGYHSDKTRCFAVGRVGREYRKAYETVSRSQDAAIKMIAPGVKIKAVDAAARKIIKESGFPVFGHGLGHGIGLEIHELPILNHKSEEKFSTGQVITVEPGIYIPGKFGIRIEDDVLVTDTGAKIISRNKTAPELKIIY
ncbi:MAG: aminopeptidase P family protein [Sedimentisphaerales bacterium]|nr:aminopeptidase P family protein [Sedimentisphaerales bacterium]